MSERGVVVFAWEEKKGSSGCSVVWVALLCMFVNCASPPLPCVGEGVFCSGLATQVGRSVQKIEKRVAGDGSLLLAGWHGGFVRGGWPNDGVEVSR